MRKLNLIAVAMAVVLSLVSCHRNIYKNPISYNFLQVDGDETRIGINGPAAIAQIPMRDEQIIVLHGEPIVSFKDARGQDQRNLGMTDTIVEVTGLVPKSGSEARLQFRLVALSLTGSFTDARGQQWQVKVSLSAKREQPQSIAVVRNNYNSNAARQGGGTFDSELHLFPRFVFTSGGEEKIVDEPDRLGVKFIATNAEWSATPPRGAVRPDLNGGFFAVKAKHGGEAGQHATKAAVVATASF
jgi:hypothetical protein